MNPSTNRWTRSWPKRRYLSGLLDISKRNQDYKSNCNRQISRVLDLMHRIVYACMTPPLHRDLRGLRNVVTSFSDPGALGGWKAKRITCHASSKVKD